MLEGIKILASLNKEDIKNLECLSQEKKIRQGDVIFSEGEEATAMYILKQGSVDIMKDNQKIATIFSEEILGEMALFGQSGKRMATAVAAEDSILITILSFSIQELIHKYPELLSKIKNIIEIRSLQNKQR